MTGLIERIEQAEEQAFAIGDSHEIRLCAQARRYLDLGQSKKAISILQELEVPIADGFPSEEECDEDLTILLSEIR